MFKLDCRGTAALEFALAAPMLLVLLGGVTDLGMAASQKQHVRTAVEAGAQWGASNYYYGGCQGDCGNQPASWLDGVRAAAQNALGDDRITVTAGDEVCACPTASATAIATGGYGGSGNVSCTGSCPDGSQPGHYFALKAAIHYKPVVPLSIIGECDLADEAVVAVQ